jgi:small-conductance mechanosensitive channel
MLDWLSTPTGSIIQLIAYSATLLAIVLGVWLATRRIVLLGLGRAKGAKPSRDDFEARRRWLVNLRNSLVFVFLVGLVFIWARELRTFAVSLVALAAATVIATKELIQCMSGSVLRVGANAFTIGDRIEVAGVRGKVIDQNLLATTVLEVGPGHTSEQFTGRAIVFPNSLLVTQAIVNESYMEDYVLLVVRIPLSDDEDWQAAENVLLEAARAIAAPYFENARRHLLQVEGKSFVDFPSIEPKVSVEIPEAKRVLLLLRTPAPANEVSRTEQAIIRRYLASRAPGSGAGASGPS